MSVAIATWSRTKEEEALEGIRRFHRGLAAKGARRVTISLLYGNAPSGNEYDNLYPINSLRNLVLRMPRIARWVCVEQRWWCQGLMFQARCHCYRARRASWRAYGSSGRLTLCQ